VTLTISSSFSLSEFNLALNSRNPRSSPGIDGLDYEIIQRLPLKYKLILLDIFNEMYKTSVYPKEWKKLFLQFIDKCDGKSVRPITLTSCICKLFETMLKGTLQWWIEYKSVLPKCQSGFRKGHNVQLTI